MRWRHEARTREEDQVLSPRSLRLRRGSPIVMSRVVPGAEAGMVKTRVLAMPMWGGEGMVLACKGFKFFLGGLEGRARCGAGGAGSNVWLCLGKQRRCDACLYGGASVLLSCGRDSGTIALRLDLLALTLESI